jgi:hypothetical protein
MKKIATFALALLAFSAVAAVAAGPFYARGGYYDAGWSADAGNQLVEGPAGVFTRTIHSSMAAGYYEGKAALGDWSSSWPNSNQPVILGVGNEDVVWSFDTNTYADTWSPSTNIAINDHFTTGLTFEVIGAATETGGWSSGVAAPLVGDVYGVTITIGTPGTYDVKFRQTGNWGINVGSDGAGTNSNNYSYTTAIPNQPVTFEFNRKTGRMRAVVGGVVPTRATTFGQLKAQYR